MQYAIINRVTRARITLVREAENERPHDDKATRDKKRRAEAQRKMEEWAASYFDTRGVQLTLQEIDRD